ncbi:uncharacterized protein LOC110831786 [Zootermopsis nevadensis]|uniref:Mite allergen Lep d 7 n=1 Tax=Zootermopsis nevadensis TaxID=136037 RepID=A0A067RC34_ZOONE|nr:uncharacterized protein LOC110831786 [Zootermopsis nevadensis]KDR17360.1 Mite allergen Lep d 7 [Zootermopsis nevadensis]
MAEGHVWLLFLLCGFHTPLESVGVQLVGIPSETQLTEALINSERHHTSNVSSTLTVCDNSEGLIVGSDDLKPLDVFNSTVCGTVNLNKIVDELLDGLRVDIIKQGKDRIKIPDIDETFNKRVYFIKVKGEFKGENGWVESLSTIHRTADAVASSYGKNLSVSCGFGLEHLEVGYDRYRAKFMRLGPHGKINGIVGKNSILLKATVAWTNQNCTVALNQLVLDSFGDFKLKVTGLGPMNWLLSKISTWILQHFESEIKGRVESTLREEIEKKLDHFDCSKYFPKP